MIPVHIVSGFLGAGKTTFIQQLINRWSQNNDPSKVLIVENDFGEVSFDAAMLGNAGLSVESLSNGCICCSLSGNFQDSLYKLVHEKDWELIVIEPSGISALSSILQACESPKLSTEITVVGATTIIDPERAPLYLANFGQFYKDQVSHATTLVLRPTVDAVRPIEDTMAILRQYAKDTPIVTEHWDDESFWQRFLEPLAPYEKTDANDIINEIDKAMSKPMTMGEDSLSLSPAKVDDQEKQSHDHGHNHGDLCAHDHKECSHPVDEHHESSVLSVDEACHKGEHSVSLDAVHEHEHVHNHNHEHDHNHEHGENCCCHDHEDLSDAQFCKLKIRTVSPLSQGLILAYVNSLTSACPAIIRAKGILPTITGPISLQYTPGHWALENSPVEGNELTIIACDKEALAQLKQTHSLGAWDLSEVH